MPNDVGAGDAKILPFPGRLRSGAGAPVREADDAAARLERALLALNQAVSEQQEVIRAWHRTIDSLVDSVQALKEKLRAADAKLAAASPMLRPDAGQSPKQ